MSTAAIALGSNLGDRLSALRKAVSLLQCAGIIVKASSDVFETLPWGETDQPLFLNACLLAETSMPPEDLLHLLKKLETDLGREGGKRWGPRVIDLDIVFYDSTILHTKDLVLPHRDMASRGFVLLPLLQLAPEWVHPESGLSVQEMADDLPPGERKPLLRICSLI